ncbi:MAG: ACT domain-containing protein [Ignavibacteriales bacterium]|nr:ACT domain-containing protein [Ignavibacteriaceae bacterium]QOJ28613.1 MAG: ACT domain-containing protein [Ignavibacteriales bacterium]
MVNEEQIREWAVEAISALGEKANPEEVKKYISQKLQNSPLPRNGHTSSAGSSQRAILTSFGVNSPGIVGAVSSLLGNSGCDILDLSQKIMQEFFTMIMVIDFSASSKDFKTIQDELSELGTRLKVKIYLQHEDVFRYMHRI